MTTTDNTSLLQLQRIENWPKHLNEYLVSVRERTYKLGTWDCCVFAAGAVKIITGIDPMKEARGQYGDSEESYREALHRIYGGDLQHALTLKFGPLRPGASGQRGDIAWYENCCGIIIGRTALFIFEEGYGLVPITNLTGVFKVGTQHV